MLYAHAHTLGGAGWRRGNSFCRTNAFPARLASILANVRGRRPSDAIPQAAGSWGQAQGGSIAFLANPRVAACRLAAGVSPGTRPRQCLEAEDRPGWSKTPPRLHLTGCRVLPETGSNWVRELRPWGCWLHSPLALTEQGAVLGVLGLQTWGAAGRGDLPGPRRRRKEAAKWLHGHRPSPPGRCGENGPGAAGGSRARHALMHRMDREGDVYEVLAMGGGDRGIAPSSGACKIGRVDEPFALGAMAAVRAQPVLGRVTLHGAAVTRQASPASDGGDAGLDDHATSRSQRNTPTPGH